MTPLIKIPLHTKLDCHLIITQYIVYHLDGIVTYFALYEIAVIILMLICFSLVNIYCFITPTG